jgi:CRP-like cAMP-binding protein
VQTIISKLHGTELFAPCTDRELATIARSGQQRSAATGDVLVREGDAGTEFFLVLDGAVTVERSGRTVAELGPGRSFGELSLLDGGRRNATVTAAAPTELFVLGQREFGAVLDGWPVVARKLLIEMTRRLRAADEHAVTS